MSEDYWKLDGDFRPNGPEPNVTVVETTPVYYHDCPALGKDTKLPRALMADSSNEYVLFWQHKCPFCSQTAGERTYARGVTQNPDGSYSVDTTIAEKLQ